MANADRLIEVFNEAKARTAGAERERFLAEACPGDPELKEQVISLLQAHESAGDFLKNTIPSPTFGVTEKPGDNIGRYKLLQIIGEGGCGVVYMAEQEEPVRRRVALKVIKLGMDTKSVIARFEAERQALAMMDHPNIAKVLDGGATDAGRPYFVMELVRGVKITEYCDEARLSTRDRLDLFIQVCQAIQSAHQKGIIHRDIKPSNILITINDGVAVPKVIDFGVAKAIEGRLTDKTLFTQFEALIGTPAYMSPEQAVMTSLDIDTRSDIYSLGVLLYELLAGSTPFDTKELMASGLDAMRKTIQEKEPVRPSTKLSQTLVAADAVRHVAPRAPSSGESISAGSAHGVTRPTSKSEIDEASSRRLLRIKETITLLRGDLDWIVMKCLEKDRARRYETANGLASDIQRHLNNEAVLARPPSAAYRFQKLVRRNKLTFAAVTSVVAALVLGLFASAWQALRATRAEGEQKRLYLQAEIARAGEVHERERAQEHEQLAQRNLYAADMHIAQQAAESFNLERAEQLLSSHRHQTNLLGFEWRYLWQQSRSQELRQFRGRALRVDAIAFSSDGQCLASRDLDGCLKVWDLRGTHERFTLTNIIALGGFVSNGSHLIVAKRDGSLGTVDALTGREIESRKLPEPVTLLLAEGTLALTAQTAEQAVVRKTASGAEVIRLTLPSDFWSDYPYRTMIAASRFGQKLAVKSAQLPSRPGTRFIELWDLERGQLITNLLYDKAVIGTLAFSPDAAVLVAGGTDGAVTVWDLRTFNIIERLPLHEGSVQDIAFSPDGKLFATGSPDQTIVVWDRAARQSVASFGGHGGLVAKLCFSPDGRLLASGNLDGTVRLWNAEYRRPPDTAATQILNPSRLVFSRDSRKLIVGCSDECVRALNLQTLQPIRSIPGVNLALGLTASGQVILARQQQRLVLWDFENGASIELPTRFFFYPSVMAISPSGRFSAFVSAPHIVEIWENADWKKSAQLAIPHDPSGLCFSADDSRLLMAELNGDVRIWNYANGSTNAIKAGWRKPSCIASSPDGQIAACVEGESSIRVLRLQDGVNLPILKGHRQFIHTLAFSPDGKTLASCSNDGTVRLWNPRLGTELAILRVFPAAPKGTDIHVWDLAFSPDGNTLVAYGGEGTLKVWRAASWEEIAAAEAKEKTESKQP